ncbi:hypothetical protein [Candidatus Palauibacter sp.]|uniref:hypothetical protein n=1 Tax=Candidatus Palauibacter sp. TaxID=3101350 RepID=UPI003CC5196F
MEGSVARLVVPLDPRERLRAYGPRGTTWRDLPDPRDRLRAFPGVRQSWRDLPDPRDRLRAFPGVEAGGLDAPAAAAPPPPGGRELGEMFAVTGPAAPGPGVGPPDDPGVFDYATTYAKAVARGLLEAAGLGIQGISHMAAAISPAEDDPRDMGFYGIGRGIREWAGDTLRPHEALEGTLHQKVPHALGSVLGYAGAAATNPAAPFLMGGSSGAAMAGERSMAAGGDHDRAALLGVLPGLAEGVPALRVIGRARGIQNISPAMKKVATNFVERHPKMAQAIMGMVEEGGQEAAAEVAYNAIARLDDPGQQLLEGIGEAGGIGGFVGALVNLLATALPGRGARPGADTSGLPAPPPEVAAAVDELRGRSLWGEHARSDGNLMGSGEYAEQGRISEPSERGLAERPGGREGGPPDVPEREGGGAGQSEVREGVDEVQIRDAFVSDRAAIAGVDAQTPGATRLEPQEDVEGPPGDDPEGTGGVPPPGAITEPGPEAGAETVPEDRGRLDDPPESTYRLEGRPEPAEPAPDAVTPDAGREPSVPEGMFERTRGLTPGEYGFAALPEGSVRRLKGSAKTAARRYLTSAGDLPRPIFDRKIERDTWIASERKNVEFLMRDFNRAEREIKGRGHRFTEAEYEYIDDALKGERPAESLPEPLQPVIGRMRESVDALSRRLLQAGAIEGPLVATVEANIGHYATRSYRVFDDPDWAKKVPAEVRNRAKSLIRSRIGKAEPELDPAALEERAEGVIGELLYREETSPLQFLASGKLGAKDLSITKKRMGIAPEIRALLGEYRDPRVNYVRSMTKMANLLANHEFLTDVRESGLGTFFHERPVVREGDEYVAEIAAEGSATLAPLNGLYTTPEIKRAFEEFADPKLLGALMRRYMKLNGFVKVSKTVLSPMTHVRNFIANPLFLVANGHDPFRSWGTARRTLAASTGLRLLGRDTPESRAYYRHLTELGVVDESTHASELHDVIRDATRRGPDDFIADPTVSMPRRGLNVAQSLYRAEDDFWKIVAFEAEKRRYREALPEVGEAEIERMAAEVVRNTVPTYSLVPRGVKNLRRMPFVGTFVSFPSEVYRTITHTFRLARSEMQSDNPAIRKIGRQRALGIAKAGMIVPAMSLASRVMLGIDEEDDEDFRKFLPPWSRNSTLVYLGRKANGDVRYVDLSYTDPYSYVRKPFQAFMRGEDFEKALYDAVWQETLQSFLGEEILAGKLADVWRNRRAAGGQVYNPAAGPEQKLQDAALHVWDALEPGAMSSAERIAMGLSGEKSPTGRSYDAREEIAAVVTGIRLQSLDLRQSLSFRASDALRSYRDAGRQLTGVVGRRGTVTGEEITAEHGDAQGGREGAWADAGDAARAALRLGVSRDEVRSILDDAGWSKRDAGAIARGEDAPVYDLAPAYYRTLRDRLGRDRVEEVRARSSAVCGAARDVHDTRGRGKGEAGSTAATADPLLEYIRRTGTGR